MKAEVSRSLARNALALLTVLALGVPYGLGAAPDPPANEDPPDMAADVAAHPTLCVDVSDPDGDPLDVRFLGRLGVAEPFTVVLLPDTQLYSESHPEIFETQTQWIADNRAARNIVYVGHLGDIVQNGSEANQVEWDRADAAMSLLEDPVTTGLDEGIPYGLAPGNHDQNWSYSARTGADEGATTRQYNETFGVHRFSGRSYYLHPHRFEEESAYPDNNDNAHYSFFAGGMRFNVFHLEFDYFESPERHATNAWLDRLLRLNAGSRNFLITHYLLKLDASFSSHGEELFEIIKKYSGPTLAACGHIHGASRRSDEYLGNVLHFMLSDYQEEPDGGQGWLRILTFYPERDEVSVETYSPWLDDYKTDEVNQFLLPYEMLDGPSYDQLGEVSGVPSGGRACVSWAGRRDSRRYQWFVEVSDGGMSTRGAVWAFESSGVCSGDGDCADGDPCTEDVCAGNICSGVHPGDQDGDGLCPESDNCDESLNRLQLDSDGDGIGDLCDVCPDDYDPGQEDEDGDALGDACDPQINDPYDRTPPAVRALRWSQTESGDPALVWDHSSGGDAYSISRGSLSSLGSDSYGSCLAEGVFDNHLVEVEAPPPGDGYFYLVQAQAYDCGMGPLGNRSDETERENLDSLACEGGHHAEVYPTDETTVYGTRTGSHANTHASDGVYEVITEELVSGPNAHSRLEHRWSFDVPAGSRIEFHVESFRFESADGESFEFEYSTNGGGTWTTLDITNPPRSDTDIDYVAELPGSVSGSVLIRVIDTDRGQNRTGIDEITLDEIFIRSAS